jgi:hypothetical protein
MPTAKAKVAILISGGLLTTGLLATFQPPSSSDTGQNRGQQSQQQHADLTDSQGKVNGRLRDDGNAHLDAQNAQKLIPGEYRPAEASHLRLRLVP